MRKSATIVGTGTTTKILAVAARKGMTADQKMRAIYILDDQCRGWSPLKWAALLDVSDPAVRDAEWWKVDRKRLREESRGS